MNLLFSWFTSKCKFTSEVSKYSNVLYYQFKSSKSTDFEVLNQPTTQQVFQHFNDNTSLFLTLTHSFVWYFENLKTYLLPFYIILFLIGIV